MGFQVREPQLRRLPQERGVVCPLARVRQPRTLQVRPQRLGPIRRGDRHPVPDLVDEAVQVVERRGHPRRQERRHSVAQQVAGHPVEGRPTAHRVVATSAVHVDVDIPGREVRGGGAVARRRGTRLHGRDPAVGDGDLPVLDAVVEDEPAGQDGRVAAHAWRSETASVGTVGRPSGRVANGRRLGSVDRRPDGTCPGPQLRRHDVDLVQGCRLDTQTQLLADRLDEEVEGDRDPATDDDAVGREDDDHVRDPDAEVAADLGEPGERPSVACSRRLDRRGDRLGPARRGEPVGPGERLEAAAVATAAQRPVGIDGLMADLTGRPVMTEMDPPVDRDHAPDPGPERQPDERARRRGRHRAGARPVRRRARR